MLPFKRIIFPVDYSDRCKSAVPHVTDMMEHFSAALTVVHAHGVGAPRYAELDVADPEWPEKVRLMEEHRLRAFSAESFPGHRVDSILDIGEPGYVIDKVVRHQGTDLVMMPTHGGGPMRRLLLGSITAKVLHDISAAVWTCAGHGATPTRNIPYKSILCAVDLSDETEVIMRAAAALAHSYHARLSLVHVVELPPPNMDVDFTSFEQDLLDTANLRVWQMKNKLGLDAPHRCFVASLASEGVCQEAVETEADLIVVGRGRSQGAMSRIWSRLYNIVRESPCPVLSI